MPRTADYARVEIEAGEEPAPWCAPESDTPFRILLMGDYSGRGVRGACDPSLKGRRPILVDRDNFDNVLERLGVELHSIRFAELDDFHPDRLYERLPVFQPLREMRARLQDRATFESAAAEMRAWAAPPAGPAAAPAPSPDLARLSPGQLFSRMMEEAAPGGPAGPAPAGDEFDRLVREIVAPYAEPRPDPRQAELIAQVDEAAAARMRAILHHPEFQALEAAWRGLLLLVRKLETGASLELHVLDIARAELAALAGAADPASSALYDIVVEASVGTPGAAPWSVLAGDFTFAAGPEDLGTLRALGRLARFAGAPFLAAASPSVAGCPSFGSEPDPRAWRAEPEADAAWEAFRRSPEAAWIGLALPRFLLRLPYGPGSASTESFAFDEMPGVPRHEEYLWGNPALACLMLLGAGFAQDGWDFRPDACHVIEDLPAHVYREGGEARLKPCAEALLTERAAGALADKGLMVLLSLKDSDRVRLLRFQSAAAPPAALPGRWA